MLMNALKRHRGAQGVIQEPLSQKKKYELMHTVVYTRRIGFNALTIRSLRGRWLNRSAVGLDLVVFRPA